MKKITILCLLLWGIAFPVLAQSGTNSPYSQYALGLLSDQSQGFNRGMGGVALGFRYNNQVNALNPASYSSVDSLTMIFDAGLSGQIASLKEYGASKNAFNANFEYAVAAFRLWPKVGLSLGLLPFSNIGYNYQYKNKVGLSSVESIESNSGSGGLHQVYVGVGWNVYKTLSLGVNLSYLWGHYEKSVSSSLSDTYVNTVNETYSATVNSYKIDLGAQWEQKLDANNTLTIGATLGIGHKLGAKPQARITNRNTQTNVSTDTLFVVDNGLSIPMTYGLGLALHHQNKWSVGIDYTLQKWGSLDFPETERGTQNYVLSSGLLKDRSKLAIGGEWIPNAASQKFFQRIHYRIGASCATPYYNMGGQKGPKEYSVSAGFGIPIINSYNNRSILNISAQWVHASAQDKIIDNTFRINLGLTFNERWFMKWKFE